MRYYALEETFRRHEWEQKVLSQRTRQCWLQKWKVYWNASVFDGEQCRFWVWVEWTVAHAFVDENNIKKWFVVWACDYVRMVYAGNDYYCYRLNGISNVFELRNEGAKKQSQSMIHKQTSNSNLSMAMSDSEKEYYCQSPQKWEIRGREIVSEDDTRLNDETYENVKYLKKLCIARGLDSQSNEVSCIMMAWMTVDIRY